ncbi:MAG: helical backbone metal receptor [Pseudomonadota bacterium]
MVKKSIITLMICVSLVFFTSKLIAKEYQRIVSLKPNITEILFELGVGDQVVGVTTYCDYPAQAQKLPKIGDYTKPFLEKIIAVKPDIVMTSKEQSSRKAILELEKIGIKVLLLSFKNLAETKESIRQIAVLVKAEIRADDIIRQMEETISYLKEKWQDQPKKEVLIVWGSKPLVVGGQTSYFNEFLELLGVENVVKSKMAYPRWSLEQVVLANPDIIMDLSMGSEANISHSQALTYWNNLTNLKAVKNKQIYLLNNSLFRPAPKIVAEISKLAEIIHNNK